jgi:hypothetical protein
MVRDTQVTPKCSASALKGSVEQLLTKSFSCSIVQSTFYHGIGAVPVEVLMNVSPLKQPSAWVPVAMSVAALAVVLGHIAIFGVVREADEGTAAHLWQLLMVGQVPAVAYFSMRWLPRAPGQASRVLALQAIAALAACAPVYWFKL